MRRAAAAKSPAAITRLAGSGTPIGALAAADSGAAANDADDPSLPSDVGAWPNSSANVVTPASALAFAIAIASVTTNARRMNT